MNEELILKCIETEKLQYEKKRARNIFFNLSYYSIVNLVIAIYCCTPPLRYSFFIGVIVLVNYVLFMKNYVKNRRFVIYPYSINNAQLERVIICFSELVGSQLTVKYQENYHSTIFSDGIILYKCVAINHQNQTMININYAIEYEFGLSFGKLKKYHSTLNDLLIAVWKGENIEEKTNEILATRANNFWAKSEFSGFRLLQKLVFYPLLCIFIIGPIVMAVVYQKLIFLLISLFFIFMFWPYIKTEIYVIRKKWKMNREKRLK